MDQNQNKSYSLEDLYKFSDNDPKALQTILEVLIINTTSDIEKFKEYTHNFKWKEAGELAHKMTSTFSHLHITTLCEQLKLLQFKIQSGSTKEDIKILAEAIIKDGNKILKEIEAEVTSII